MAARRCRCSSRARFCNTWPRKAGNSCPTDVRGRAEVMQWLFWQMGGLGPMAGQNHHFVQYAPEPIDYAITRYVNETNRLYGVLNKRLADREFVAGDTYSIADMAIYPWIVPHERQRQKLEDFPHLARWFAAIAARPATVRAYARAAEINVQPTVSGDAKSVLFGQTAKTVGLSNGQLPRYVEKPKGLSSSGM